MYQIKAHHSRKEFLEIISEKTDGYDVRIIKEIDDERSQQDEFMSKELFDLCLRTGYLRQCSGVEEAVSA